MKAKHVNPFLNAVSNILQMVVNIEPKKGEIKKGEGIKSDKLYTMYFTLNNGLEGFFALSFDEEVALKIVEKMTGMQPERLDEMGYSALKEIVEMVKGNAITDLSNIGIECDASETLFSDSEVEIEQDAIILTMDTELGKLDNHFYFKRVIS